MLSSSLGNSRVACEEQAAQSLLLLFVRLKVRCLGGQNSKLGVTNSPHPNGVLLAETGNVLETGIFSELDKKQTNKKKWTRNQTIILFSCT